MWRGAAIDLTAPRALERSGAMADVTVVTPKKTTVPRAYDELAEALRAHHGLVSLAAAALGIARESLHRRIRQSKQLQAVLAEAREHVTDVAEASLFRAIEGGEAWAVCFYLKTQGRARGYIEKQGAVDVTTGGAPARSRRACARR
jgi:hypothetical protein